MNKRLSKLSAIILVTAIILSAMPMIMPAVKAIAPPLPAVWIVPDTLNFNTSSPPPGMKFNVTVYMGTTVAVFAYQVYVEFNTLQIKIDRAGYTAGTTSAWFAGHSTSKTSPVLDNSTNPGSVAGGETLFSPDSVPASSGSVMWLEFEIIASPAPGQTLTSQITPVISGTKRCKLIDTNGAEMTGVSSGSATFNYQWSAPTNPHMEVRNETSVTFASNVHWVGTTFVEDVYIASVNGAWFLTNASTQFAYNSALLAVSAVAFDPLWNNYTNFVNASGLLTLTASTNTPQSGDVLLAKVTFKIISEQSTITPGTYRSSPRTLNGTALASSVYPAVNPITVDPQINQPPKAPTPIYPVIVYDFLLATPPYLSVSSITLGPGPVTDQLFNVTVTLNNVTESIQHLIGIEYRLQYNDTLIQPVAVYEGPFFMHFADLEAAAGYPPSSYPPGTYITSVINDPDGIYGPHVAIGQMIFPNATGRWNEPLPDGSGVITIVTFRLLYQSYGEPNFTSDIDICGAKGIGLNNMAAQVITAIPLSPSINGTVTITTNLPGRTIDLYGGAVNSGYGVLFGPFPAPYGGQGPNAPMDLVEPQSFVNLYANVTYNYWPVQHKNVAFEIVQPDGTVYNKLSAFTDDNGVATIGFRMPWPCVDPESLFGVWNITATVQLADVVMNDTMRYHYDYMVHIWKVTTDKFQYNHNECVHITIDYGSHAQQTYPVLFFVSIVDNLGVTVGTAFVNTTLGGTVFCQYLNSTVAVTICLPKWAYAGIATVHVNAFDIEPALGGVAITPEYVGPTIAIQPH